MPQSDILIVAAQTDGLGARLTTMSTAMLLADRAGCRFGFAWKAADFGTHAVEAASEIFDKAFLNQHWLGEKVDRNGFGLLDHTPYSVAELEAEARRRDLKGWICEIGAYRHITQDPAELARGRSKVFRTIGFSPRIRAVMDRATAAPLPKGAIALHLRAGDIVYGNFRQQPRFATRVVPAPLAPSIISRLRQQGGDVVLFGEDSVRLERLHALTGCQLADDFGAPRREAATDRAFFEATLMGRSRTIYGGLSAFTIFASIPNATPIVDPRPFFAPHEMRTAILAEIANNGAAYNPVETSAAYLVMALAGTADIGEREKLLQAGLSHDPANQLYPLKLAAIAFATGRFDDGEAILRRALDAADIDTRGKIARPLQLLMAPSAPDNWRSEIDHFANAAAAGHPSAAACMAAYLSGRGEYVAAMGWMEAALRSAPADEVFRRLARRIGQKRSPIRQAGKRIWAFVRGRRTAATS